MATQAQHDANIKKLLAAGVSQSFIDSELASGKAGLAKGSKIDDKDVQAFIDAWKSTPGYVSPERQSSLDAKISALPDAIKNDPTFQNLPTDLKEIAVYNYNVQVENNAQKVKALADSLEAATAQAGPYWANIIRIAQTEVQNGFAEITGDYNAQNENMKRQIKYIEEDLATNKQNLSLEEQASLGSLAADLRDRQQTYERNMMYLGGEKASQLANLELEYNKNVDDINRNTTFTNEEKASALEKIAQNFTAARGQVIGAAADAGLTFSTKRKIAEQRLSKENEGLVESTNRSYNKTLADLESAKAFTNAGYASNVASTERQFGQRTAEEEQAFQTSQRLIQEEREKIQRQYAAEIAKYETEAQRGNVQAQAAMADLSRKLTQSIQNLGLSAEKYLGTDKLPTLPGYAPLGGVTGGLYEDMTKDIASRQSAIYNEKTATSLNF